jgi:hypothetical protein
MASAQILTNGKALYAYNGTEWIPLNTSGNLVNSTRWQYTAVGSETSLSGNDDNGESLIYTPGYEQVYLNGVLLARDADYTATTGTSITGLTALTAGYIVEVIAYNNINVGNTYTQNQIDTKIADTFERWTKTVSASGTVISGLDDSSVTLDYTAGLEKVYINGILLAPEEYVATSGSAVILDEAVEINDIIQIHTLKNFRVANHYTINQTNGLLSGYLSQSSASSTYLTQSSASTTYAPVAAGGLTLLNTTSFTAQSSVSVNDVFSSTYDFYKIIIVAENSSAQWQLNLRLRVSGSDNSSSNYYWSGFYQTFASATPALNTQGSNGLTTSFQIGNTSNPTATLGNQHIVEIGNPFSTSETTFNSAGVGYETSPGVSSSNRFTYGGMTSVTTSYTGFTIFPASANISGTVSVYGYKK